MESELSGGNVSSRKLHSDRMVTNCIIEAELQGEVRRDTKVEETKIV